MNKRVAIVTNNSECEKHVQYYSTLVRYVRANGWQVVEHFDADWVLICACGFHDFMVKKVEAVLRALGKRDFPGEQVLLLGCMPGTHEGPVASLPVGRVIGLGQEQALDEIFGQQVPFAEVEPTHVYDPEAVDPARSIFHVKISQGCLQRCTFCVINRAKGPLTSVPVAEVVRQVELALRQGHRQIFLMGEDTFAYGKDSGSTIVELVAALQDLSPALELHFGCLHVWWLVEYAEELLSLCRAGVIKELQVGLQHVDEGLLARMGRAVDFARAYGALTRIRQACPDLLLSVDILVGFPGETEAQFQRLMDFFEQDRVFDQVSHFGYSDIAGTAAHGFVDKVDPLQVAMRWERLRAALGPRSLHNPGAHKNERYHRAYLATFEKNYSFCASGGLDPK